MGIVPASNRSVCLTTKFPELRSTSNWLIGEPYASEGEFLVSETSNGACPELAGSYRISNSGYEPSEAGLATGNGSSSIGCKGKYRDQIKMPKTTRKHTNSDLNRYSRHFGAAAGSGRPFWRTGSFMRSLLFRLRFNRIVFFPRGIERPTWHLRRKRTTFRFAGDVLMCA